LYYILIVFNVFPLLFQMDESKKLYVWLQKFQRCSYVQQDEKEKIVESNLEHLHRLYLIDTQRLLTPSDLAKEMQKGLIYRPIIAEILFSPYFTINLDFYSELIINNIFDIEVHSDDVKLVNCNMFNGEIPKSINDINHSELLILLFNKRNYEDKSRRYFNPEIVKLMLSALCDEQKNKIIRKLLETNLDDILEEFLDLFEDYMMKNFLSIILCLIYFKQTVMLKLFLKRSKEKLKDYINKYNVLQLYDEELAKNGLSEEVWIILFEYKDTFFDEKHYPFRSSLLMLGVRSENYLTLLQKVLNRQDKKNIQILYTANQITKIEKSIMENVLNSLKLKSYSNDCEFNFYSTR
jgi:hypothetical protein